MEEIWRCVGELQGQVHTLQWMVGFLIPTVFGIYPFVYLLYRNGKNGKKKEG